MKKLILAAVLLAAAPALADETSGLKTKKPEAPATVTLTQQELGQIVQAEVGAAIAIERAREGASAVYSKVQTAFAPKK